MPDETKPKNSATGVPESAQAGPYIFISHDGRDAELAEALSKLLKSVSAGMLRTFRSSDKKGAEGIEYGDEWYNRLMSSLERASDVVCLFTERSLGRPWILFEAGVAKGKRNTPVWGIALGVPLAQVTTGPFYQFQNLEDSEEELTKLVHQLAKRVPGVEPDHDVVRAQVQNFKKKAGEALRSLSTQREQPKQPVDVSAVAKLFEEIKVMFRDLPERLEGRLAESTGLSRKRMRRLHPRMLMDMLHGPREMGEAGLLAVAGLARDQMPWFYEITMDVVRALRSGDAEAIAQCQRILKAFPEMLFRGPWAEAFIDSPEADMIAHELPHLLDRRLSEELERLKPKPPRRPRKEPEGGSNPEPAAGPVS